MPMWQHNRKPSPPQHAVHTPVAAEALSADLMDAVAANDMAAARKVFDRAFWDKSDFRPDGYHLLHAVKRGNRDMAKLLTTHGARWTPEESRIARRMTGPEPWSAVEGVLRQAGMRTQFTEAELRDINPVLMTAWARRSVEHAEQRNSPDAERQRRELERVTVTGIVLLMKSGDTQQAIGLLLARGKKFGDGSPQNPLDVSREASEMAALEPQAPVTVLKFLDALKARGLDVKPVRLSGTLMTLAPGLIKEIDARGLLSEGQAEDRMSLAWNWACIQPKIDMGGGAVIELPPDFVEERHATLAQAAKVLFRKDRPASAAEADYFVGMHESRAKTTPYALARMETALLDTGFFDSPAFTVKHLRQLADTAPGDAGCGVRNLSDNFNRLASARLIADHGAEKFLSSAKFHEIETAHRLRAWKASPAEAVKILDYLASQVKKDAVPDSVVAALKTLRDGGADFSRVEPMRYLGKKAPGLCKTLLDLGIVAARDIDLDALARRSGGELRPLTPRTAEGFADQEFMCQIVLESLAPDKFIPLRAQPDVSYQREFLREYTTNPQMKRRFMAGRIHAPKP
ncbi:MAG: hypothetical protein EPN97_05505 [Alphaproteobacteria bacterium]|nr:MAG: hypothetical protein EPN97_05505 [Alphaproteobacteria bacterium]